MKHLKMPPRHRNNIALVKNARPKRVTFPNGRVTKRSALTDNVTIRCTYKK